MLRILPAPPPQAPTPRVTDPDAPLLCRHRATACFSRRKHGDPLRGTIYPQFHSPQNHRLHPEFFYVEWPEDSADYREIHAPTLARIYGVDAPTGHRFSSTEVAVIMAGIPIPVPTILQAARPR